MPELIDVNDASVLREVARSIRNHNRNHSKSERNAILITQNLDFAADVIDKMASGNIAIVRRGEWVETEPDEDDRKLGIEISIKCSICHDENSHLDFNENSEITGKTFWRSRFCPNCGAKMNDHIADVSKKVGADSGK